MELSLPFPRRAVDRASSRRTRARRLSKTRTGSALDWLRGNRLALRATLCALIAIPLLGGGWMWLRDSSLVAVRHVHISGVHGVDAIEIRMALGNAATRMTTMDFDPGALRKAVSSFAIVDAVRVSTSFPHTVSISVSERPPVAALLTAGQRTAVAADGTVLGPALLSSSLPTIKGAVEPPVGARLREAGVLDAVGVLGAAPALLAPFVVRVFSGPEGLTVAMRNGLLVYFGNALRAHAKWTALARVLVSPSAAGALYVDVRLPERPAAGFSSSSLAGASAATTSNPASTAGAAVPSSAGSTAAATEAGASNPTAAALAASLEKATGAGAGASTGSSTPPSGAGESEASKGSSASSGASERETSSGSSTVSGAGESTSSNGSSTASGSGENEASRGSSEASISASGGSAPGG
jgi:cell division protein FtsQ